MTLDPLLTLKKIAASLVVDSSTALGLNEVAGSLVSDLGYSFCFVLLNRSDSERPVAAGSSGLNISDFRKLDARTDIPPFKTAFSTDQNHILIDIDKEPELEFLHYIGNAARLMAVPIRNSAKTFGLLCVGDKDDHGLAAKANFVELVATLIGQALRVEVAVLSERERLREENLHLKQELKEKYDLDHIVGNSNAIRQVYDQVNQVARSNATVLLRGESGTGKEMIANAIHYNSLRSKGPFIKLNCAALPDTLIESELFGHERGAFTGADRMKRGRFELADGGTLFLDEIGDVPLQTQIKLLRVLQEREFERLGSVETRRSNIRLITATNKNLESAIAAGTFREDLYYRLNVFSIHLPPLRERKSDILLLAEHFLEKYETEHGKRIRRISTPAIDMLMSYHYPGNVRELENAIERAVLVCDSNVIHGHHLPPTLQTAEVSGTVTSLSLSAAVDAFERDLIQDALKSTRGNIAKAARMLDSTERILGYKIKNLGIVPTRFRQ
ncbi:MAG TPA: sigma 54-interacting transcriptional regulator [Pyrinomonadaceae bacterium]|nr:sigma 54-interacting transcriptional regulator [Pyrinomonadaceae bacterium]